MHLKIYYLNNMRQNVILKIKLNKFAIYNERIAKHFFLYPVYIGHCCKSYIAYTNSTKSTDIYESILTVADIFKHSAHLVQCCKISKTIYCPTSQFLIDRYFCAIFMSLVILC